MKLHIFNPEHDIALARNDKYFTAPRAGRRLREDCGFLPALWADEGDFVLVGDVAKARQLLADAISTMSSISSQPLVTVSDKINFVTLHDLHKLPNDIQVEPWDGTVHYFSSLPETASNPCHCPTPTSSRPSEHSVTADSHHPYSAN